MELAVVLNVHGDPGLNIDTLDSIFKYATDNVLVVVDGAAWKNYSKCEMRAAKVKGFYHNVPKSPYRNMALGLKLLLEQWPSADWYCYSEGDVLFASNRFLKALTHAEKMGVWMLGNDGHVDSVRMPIIETMAKIKPKSTYYLLGCCQFFSRHFMEKLLEFDFFDRFLFLTSAFDPGYFPAYNGYDINEHMYPTLCRSFGGAIGVFATWSNDQWHGSYEIFPMRWKPELDPDTENFPDASILHPIKKYMHPIRVYQREKRGIDGNSQWNENLCGTCIE